MSGDNPIRALIAERAATAPDAPWLIDPTTGRVFDNAALLDGARRVAGALSAAGLPPGCSVGYALPNGPAAALAILGTLAAGYRLTAINLVAGPDTIAYVIDHAECRAILSDASGREALPEVLPCPVIEIDRALDAAPASLPTGTPEGPGAGLLMYTSGTTGRPKGVQLSPANLIAGGQNTARAHELSAEDRALCVLPLYHINGLCVTVMAPLVSSGAVVMPPKFSTGSFWELIREHRCSWFSVVPTQIGYLLHQSADHTPIPGLRFGRSASAPLSPDALRDFESRFGVPLIETMGLTETSAQILANPLPPGTRKPGSAGMAFGNAVRIAAKGDRPCPIGTEGEIQVRGDNVMQGYKDNPAATEEALCADGWLRTGDLGRIDEDGYVYVTGRLKELIIKGGENIAPREIDEALLAHPAVLEAAAFARPCGRYGQRVEAGVVLADIADEDALLTHCRERLGAFKAPDRIHLLDELPKGPSGKVQRLKLAEWLLAE